MKTKKLLVALFALGAYFSSNAQQEWAQPQATITPAMSLTRTGSILLNLPTGGTGTTTKYDQYGLTIFNNGTYGGVTGTIGSSGLSLVGNGMGLSTQIDLNSSFGSLSLKSNNSTITAISVGCSGITGTPFTVSSLGAVNAASLKTTGIALIGATAQDGTSALTVPTISYKDAPNYNSYSISPTQIVLTKIASSQGAPNGSTSITSGGINIASLTSVPFNVSNPNMNIFKINSDGSVVIGTSSITTPGAGSLYKLYVEKGILTEKVKVAVSTTTDWADFVFANNYKLKPLKEVETYITANKHLPGVPSANEMVSNGLDVAKSDALLLQKVEELTLYIIELQKQVDALKK
jgi:trimeric autotransporter adhesin